MKTGWLLILFISSCGGRIEKFSDGYEIRYFNKDDFEIMGDLKGEKQSGLSLWFPKRLLLLDDYLIVSEKGTDTLIHILHRADLSEVGKVGIDGLGPGEIDYPWRIFADPDHGNEFWVFDVAGRKMLSHFAADQATDNLYSDLQISLEDSLWFLMDFEFSSDSTLLGTGANGAVKFHEFSLKSGKSLNHWGDWDYMGRSGWPANVTMALFSGRVAANKSREIFVFSSVGIDHLEILNKSTGRLLGLRGPLDIQPNVDVDMSTGYPMLMWKSKEDPLGYVKATVTENYIYALFSGYPSHEVNRSQKGWDKLMMFRLDGSPYAFYQLDTQLIDFEVDAHNGKIYGLTATEEDPHLVIFSVDEKSEGEI